MVSKIDCKPPWLQSPSWWSKSMSAAAQILIDDADYLTTLFRYELSDQLDYE